MNYWLIDQSSIVHLTDGNCAHMIGYDTGCVVDYWSYEQSGMNHPGLCSKDDRPFAKEALKISNPIPA